MKGREIYRTFRQALVVLCVFTDASVDDQDCVYQDCICDGSAIICEAQGLIRIPSMTSSGGNYTILNLAVNGIRDIPAGSFPPNLTVINLQENPIKTIADTAFDGSASTLKTLYFSSVLFTRIPDAFGHLNSINLLNMQNAKIHDWNEEAMKNISHSLVSLYLDNVGLTSWPSWLQYSSHLTQLTISRSFIASIPDGAFDNFADTLNILTISSSNLTEIPKALSRLIALQQLYIQQSNIVGVTWLPRDSKLVILSLSNNLISDATLLSNALRTYADSLSNLDITHNKLAALPDFTFLTRITDYDFTFNMLSDANSGAVASNVQSIDFSHNFLPAIPRVMTTLQSVSRLTASSNSISQIRAADIPPTTTIVDLSFNLITELTDNSFPSKSKLTTLNLNNNPIVTISKMAFTNLGQLTELNLQGTRLSRLPLALSSLTSLYHLDMTNNDDLVCTCQEKSLEYWLVRIPRIYVLGNCGILDIGEFFTKLSPSCPS